MWIRKKIGQTKRRTVLKLSRKVSAFFPLFQTFRSALALEIHLEFGATSTPGTASHTITSRSGVARNLFMLDACLKLQDEIQLGNSLCPSSQTSNGRIAVALSKFDSCSEDVPLAIPPGFCQSSAVVPKGFLNATLPKISVQKHVEINVLPVLSSGWVLQKLGDGPIPWDLEVGCVIVGSFLELISDRQALRRRTASFAADGDCPGAKSANFLLVDRHRCQTFSNIFKFYSMVCFINTIRGRPFALKVCALSRPSGGMSILYHFYRFYYFMPPCMCLILSSGWLVPGFRLVLLACIS